MSVSDILKVIVLMVGGLVFFVVFFIVVSRVSLNHAIKKRQKINQLAVKIPDGFTQMEDRALIIESRQTSMMINQYPVMEVRFAIFPQDAPMIVVPVSRAFTYDEIPYLRVNTMVRVSYQYNAVMLHAGVPGNTAVQKIRILGPAQAEWEGSHSVKDATNTLLARLEGSKLIDTQGEILRIEKTDASFAGYPVYRYQVRFQTHDGYDVSGDTYEAVRPWLEQQRFTGCRETIQYSATNHDDFVLARR